MSFNRFRDALAIQNGACNPVAVVKTIDNHITWMRSELNFTGFDQLRNDHALRLMVHQLAHLFGVYEIYQSPGHYEWLIERCEEKKDEVFS